VRRQQWVSSVCVGVGVCVWGGGGGSQSHLGIVERVASARKINARQQGERCAQRVTSDNHFVVGSARPCELSKHRVERAAHRHERGVKSCADIYRKKGEGSEHRVR
jgi:hypothetical protein